MQGGLMQAGATRVSTKLPLRPSRALKRLRGPRLWENEPVPHRPCRLTAQPVTRMLR